MADGPITRVKACKQCGNQYEWIWGQRAGTGGCCTKACFGKWDADRQRRRNALICKKGWTPATCVGSCRICGVEFQFDYVGRGRRQSICLSVECKRKYVNLVGEKARRRRGARPRAEEVECRRIERKPVPCKQCALPFTPRSSKKNQLQIFCSMACRTESKRLYRTEKDRRQAHRRAAGHMPIDQWRAKQEDLVAARKVKRDAERNKKYAERTCRNCNGPMELDRVGFSGAPLYCLLCSETLNAAARRVAKARRRAVLRSVTIEKVDPFKVFDRDGWRCHLCGCKTPKELRGTYKDRAPELDHIVPLSKGGAHSYANTACSCRKCNGAKGDTILGQPSLLIAA